MSEYVNYDGLKRYDELIKNVISVKTWMGSCSTAAGTAAKVISVESGFKLLKGVRIGVKFTNSNTASNVTLNVNSTGAKSIYYNNAVYTGTSDMICGYANRYVFYVYDGTNWVWDGYSNHDNTTYSSKAAVANGTDVSLVTTGEKAAWNAKTSNTGTITGIKMNGVSKGTSGVVDLGTVITAHQDISGKVDKTTTVNGHALSGNVSVTASDVGLGNVGNFKAVSTVASLGLNSTEQANARANIGAGTSSFSGSYNDLSNKPSIPAAANNGTYTIKTLVGSTATNVSDFTANQSSADDVTFVQGSNVTITPDATNRKITIAATDTKYNFSGTSFTSNNSTAVNANDVTYNAHTYYTSNGPTTSLGASTNDGALYSQAYSTSWVGQIAQDYRNGGLYVRGKNNGTWQSWYKIWDSRNLTNLNQLSNGPGYITGITKTMVTNALGYTPPTTNTWRPVQCNGTDIGSNTLNIEAGLNALVVNNGGTITIAASDTWRPLGTTSGTACEGNDSRLSNARPASDVYSWAKASTKPTYVANEIIIIDLHLITSDTSSSCNITGTNNIGKAQTIIYLNNSSSDLTVTVPTNGIWTPDGEPIELTCPVGGYCEVSYLNVGNNIFARGL